MNKNNQPKLTLGIETLAAHIPRAEIVRAAGKNPRFACRNVTVERRREGREDGVVGNGRGRRGERSRRWDAACRGIIIDAMRCTEYYEAEHDSWQ